MAEMELSRLFSQEITGKVIVSDTDIPISRSVFIKSKLNLMHTGPDYERMLREIEEKEYRFSDYKVIFMKHQYLDIDYQLRLQKCRECGSCILGDFSIHEPDIIFGITFYDNVWYFGRYEKNNTDWQKHIGKPDNFSNSLPVRVARTVINIAVGNETGLKLVDPCCGVGTVLLEAYEMGVAIDGYDISYRNITHTRNNVAFYGYEISCIRSDIRDIEKKYDVAVIDLPYDLYAKISREEQYAILRSSYDICGKLVLVTNSDNRNELEEIGYTDIEMSSVVKQQFKRYIIVAHHHK